MACKCAPALDVLKREVDALFPNRDKASDGCCGDAAHAARKSEHNPSLEGYARARDIDEDIIEGIGDRELDGLGLVLLADKRCRYLIYEAELLYPDGRRKPYSGINAHRHHLHITIHDWAVHDTRPWGIAAAFAPAPIPAPPTEDDMPLTARYVKRGDEKQVWLAGLVVCRPVTLFDAAEAQMREEGVKHLPGPSVETAGFEAVHDGKGVKRFVQLVDEPGARQYGLPKS